MCKFIIQLNYISLLLEISIPWNINLESIRFLLHEFREYDIHLNFIRCVKTSGINFRSTQTQLWILISN